MDPTLDDPRFAADSPEENHRSWWAWAFWGPVAFLVFELTTNSTLAAVVACCKFGWDDLVTAVWLLRRDPLRRRAWASFWFYVAYGLWRISVTATVVGVTLGLIIALLTGGAGQAHDVLAAVLVQAIVGVQLQTGATILGVFFALRAPCRVWVSDQLHPVRRRREWPIPTDRLTRQSGGRILTTAIVVMLFVVGLVALLVVTSAWFALAPRGPNRMLFRQGLAVGVPFFTVVVFPVLVLLLRNWSWKRVLASHARQCWPEAEQLPTPLPEYLDDPPETVTDDD